VYHFLSKRLRWSSTIGFTGLLYMERSSLLA
jgi:hypothetical protein